MRWPRVNDWTSEPVSGLGDSCCTLAFSKHLGHLFARLSLADAFIVLNPETRGLGDDVIAGRESHAAAGILRLLRTSIEHVAMQDRHDAE